MTLCGANYHERVRDVKRVAALGQLHSRDRVWCAHVPILVHTRGLEWLSLKQESNTCYLDSFVPRTRSKNATLGRLEPFDDLYRRFVLGDLLRLSGLNVEETRSIVTTTGNNLVPFLWSVK